MSTISTSLPSLSRLRWLGWMCLALTVAGCVPSRKKVQTEIVRRIVFLDNGGAFSGHNDLQLRSSMEQQKSPPLTFTFPFMYFLRPSKLSLDTLRADSRRLETWYAHHGWFDMRMVGWEIRRVRPRTPKRAGVVDILGTVEPGPRSVLRDIEWRGLRSGDASGTVVRASAARAGLQRGEAFDLDIIREARALAVQDLQENLHAYAEVDINIEAYPTEEAVDLTLDVKPGITARFGQVQIDGARRVDEDDIRSLLSFTPGQPFKISKLRDSQSALFDSELFALVDVEPDLSDPSQVDVPIRVRLTESKFRRFRFGAGATYDQFNLVPQLQMNFRDVNVAGTKLQLEATAGAGAIIGVLRDDDGTPRSTFVTFAGELDLNYPWLLKRRLALRINGKAERDAEFGTLPYQQFESFVKLRYVIPKVPGLQGVMSIAGGPYFVYRNYLENSESSLQAARARFGGDFTGNIYQLLTFDISLLYDSRDNPHPLSTKAGGYAELNLRQSIPVPIAGTGSAFEYFRIDGEIRRWLKPRANRNGREPWVFAGRLHGVAVIPESRDTALPHPDLAYLGGPSSLRGYRSQAVGPYDAIARYPDGRPSPQHSNGERTRVDYSYVPRGGVFAGEIQFEARAELPWGLSTALFADGGVMWHRSIQEGDRGFASWGASGGVGLRYASPIGPVRLDFAMRPTHPWDLGTPYDSSSATRSGAHTRYFGFNPNNVLPRGYDIATGNIRARRSLAAGIDPLPVAFNIFLAIGEAF